jgi:hypothetical protein
MLFLRAVLHAGFTNNKLIVFHAHLEKHRKLQPELKASLE